MNHDQIQDLALRLLAAREAAGTAESAARTHWDTAQAIETRLRETLHGNHTALVLAGVNKVAIITDQGVDLHDLVMLGDEAGAAREQTEPQSVAVAVGDQATTAVAPPVTRALLRDVCRDAAKILGPETVRGMLGGKVDAIPEADLAAKAAAIRAAVQAKGAA